MLRFLALSLSIIFTIQLTGQPAPMETGRLKWTGERLAPGLKWERTAPNDLFKGKQYLNLLKVNVRRRPVALAYEDTLRKPTSTFAEENDALAAVNAGFFDMRDGGSVTYLKVNGQVVNQTRPEITARESVALKGVFIIEHDGDVRIEDAADTTYLTDPGIRDALVTGPFLIDDGVPIELDEIDFNDDRHPRTCACVTRRGKLLLLTADGRNEQAQGLSLSELTKILQKLRCWDAVNFDGGGSTTMYIQGARPNGVVNHPSDNGAFDSAGEREVANALIVQ